MYCIAFKPVNFSVKQCFFFVMSESTSNRESSLDRSAAAPPAPPPSLVGIREDLGTAVSTGTDEAAGAAQGPREGLRLAAGGAAAGRCCPQGEAALPASPRFPVSAGD